MLCSRCNKNIAVIFVNKIGDNAQERLCFTCAKQMGVMSLEDIISTMGEMGAQFANITEEQMDEMNQELSENIENIFPKMDEWDEDSSLSDVLSLPDQKDNKEDSNKKENDLFSQMFGGNNFFPSFGQSFPFENSKKETKNNKSDKAGKKLKYLDGYGINLAKKAEEGLIDRVIGREVEIDRIIQILNRRTKNNPILIGEPGVGKTAVAEGLAVRIKENKVPAKLLNKKVYLLDLTALIAGTHFRGQFETRIKGVIEEIKKDGNIILVIDEVHKIVSVGDAEGAMNAANILKPALARGEIQVIGATTINEYRKYIEKDAALERRFQPIMLEEPSKEEAIEILKGIKDYYEKYHNVLISDEVIEFAVEMSKRYITDRYLPDKAIDVIDEAGSLVNLKNVELLELIKLNDELKKIQAEKENAVSADSIEDYKKAADLKIRECNILEDIKQIEAKLKDYYVTIEDVARVIEMWTKIPVQKMTKHNKLESLEADLKSQIIGQDKAIENIVRGIRRVSSGIKVKKRPLSFIFVGPTGVGKTEIVKVLAKVMFGDKNAFIRLDMSEYMEKHTTSKMIGSPPGYIGYDEEGQLTEKVRRNPYSIILLDEIEKAHYDVFNILLQILDDGILKDSRGRVVHFENTIIIMTSNAGSNEKTASLGFLDSGKESEKIMTHLKNIFRTEFLNRVDEILVFESLDRESLFKIVDLMLSELREEMNLKLEVTDLAKEYIIEKGYNPKYGARELRRVISREIEDRLADLVIKGENLEHVLIDSNENGIEIIDMAPVSSFVSG